MKGVVPGIGPHDRVVLWGGGIWNWLDPLTVIRAVHRLRRPEVKLFVLGTTRPNAGVPTMAMQMRAVALAEELGVLGTTVFFNEGWVPYERRAAYLLEADVGVSAHLDELEARFAYRTRLLDCIWAALPIVTTDGDSLAELVEHHGLGLVVSPEDIEGYAVAIGTLLDRGRESFTSAFDAVRGELAWQRSVDRLEWLLLLPKAGPRATRAPAMRQASYLALRVRVALATRGVLGLGRRIGASFARAARGDRAAHP
jgi:glycosyltransferase involved in cell wall biosynthesis